MRASALARFETGSAGTPSHERSPRRRVSDRIEALSNAGAYAKELARRDGSAQFLVYDTRGNLTSEFVASDDSTATLSASHSAHVRRLPA